MAWAAALVVLGGCSYDEPRADDLDQTATQGRDEELQDYARALGVEDPPAVEVVREVSPEEQVEAVRGCMEEHGYSVVDPQSSTLEWNIPEGGEGSFSLAIYTCNARYPIGQEFKNPLGAEGRGALWDHWVQDTIPCLEALGYTVDVPPSRETFVAGAVWDPRASTMEQVLADVEQGRWQDEESVYTHECPTEP